MTTLDIGIFEVAALEAEAVTLETVTLETGWAGEKPAEGTA